MPTSEEMADDFDAQAAELERRAQQMRSQVSTCEQRIADIQAHIDTADAEAQRFRSNAEELRTSAG